MDLTGEHEGFEAVINVKLPLRPVSAPTVEINQTDCES